MKTFGEPLRLAREAKGVDIDSVAEITRISRRYLHALERSDLDGLPGGAFDKGYIKTYAEFLEIDAEPLLAAYSSEARRRGIGTPERDREMLEEMKKLLDRRGGKRRRGAWGLLLAVLVVMGGAVWLLLPRAAPEPPAPPMAIQTVEPEPEPEPPHEETHRLRVTHSGIGTSIVERNLSGRGTRFVEGTKLWYWTRVVGGGPGERIQHVWIHEGRTSLRADLSLGGAHWRTYSTWTLPPGSAGSWVVEARTDDGRLLARDEFVCVPTS